MHLVNFHRSKQLVGGFLLIKWHYPDSCIRLCADLVPLALQPLLALLAFPGSGGLLVDHRHVPQLLLLHLAPPPAPSSSSCTQLNHPPQLLHLLLAPPPSPSPPPASSSSTFSQLLHLYPLSHLPMSLTPPSSPPPPLLTKPHQRHLLHVPNISRKLGGMQVCPGNTNLNCNSGTNIKSSFRNVTKSL